MSNLKTKRASSIFALAIVLSLIMALFIPFAANAALVVTADPAPDAEVGVAYNQTIVINASGGTGPYNCTPGVAGLGLTAVAGINSITITGTPTGSGNVSINVAASDSALPFDNGSTVVSVNVIMPTFVAGSLPNAVMGTPYTATATVTGGSGGYTFASPSANLTAAGLAIDGVGAITGTPTISGNLTFSVLVADSLARAQTLSYTLNITGGLTITTASLPDATVNTAYAQALSSSGGTTPYSYVLKFGALPAGMRIDSAGEVRGTPTETGNFLFTIEASDSVTSTNTKQFTLRVNPKDPTPPSSTYSVTSGAGQIYSGSGNLTYVINAPLSKFSSVSLNGSKLPSANYSVASGSTKITLYSGLLNTLKRGTHSLVFNFSDGSANTSLYIGTDSAGGSRPPVGGVAVIADPNLGKPVIKPAETKPNEFQIAAETIDEGVYELVITK